MTELVQRWRLVLRRRADAEPLTHRDLITRWHAGLARVGLSVEAGPTGQARARLAFALPLPLGMPAERELADLTLTERWAIADVRDLVTGALPDGFELVELYDVWIGEPALPGQVVAADYRVRFAIAVDPAALEAAGRALLASQALPRTRTKGERSVPYDLRPLLDTVGPVALRTGATELDVRVRHHAEIGAGRPEEVVAALADQARTELPVSRIVRLRIVLARELR